MKRYPGAIFELPEQRVEAGRANRSDRIDLLPPDVAAELEELREELLGESPAFSHRLAVRCMREVIHTLGRDLPEVRKRRPYNPAWLCPDDLEALGLREGDPVTRVSEHGRIPARVSADPDLRSGVVSMSHGWGGLPVEERSYDEGGSSTSLLVSSEEHLERITGMPRLSAIPVRIEPR